MTSHGQYDTLLELLKKAPKADLTLAVGDLTDRGPKSRQVIEYFMNTPNTEAIMGNHDLIFLLCVQGHRGELEKLTWNHTPYDMALWYNNGGWATIESYGGLDFIPKEHLRWLNARPLYYDHKAAWNEPEGLFVSHAPVWSVNDIPKKFCKDYNITDSWVWNREQKAVMPGVFQVHGHNWRIQKYECFNPPDFKPHWFAQCIDSSSTKELVCLHWNPSDPDNHKKLFKQYYVY